MKPDRFSNWLMFVKFWVHFTFDSKTKNFTFDHYFQIHIFKAFWNRSTLMSINVYSELISLLVGFKNNKFSFRLDSNREILLSIITFKVIFLKPLKTRSLLKSVNVYKILNSFHFRSILKSYKVYSELILILVGFKNKNFTFNRIKKRKILLSIITLKFIFLKLFETDCFEVG